MALSIAVTRGVATTPSRIQPKELGVRRFRPLLALGYQQNLRALIEQLSERRNPEEAKALLNEAVVTVGDHMSALFSFGLTLGDLIPTVRYSAALRVLRDLTVQGWSVRYDDEGAILDPPGSAVFLGSDPERGKEALRRSFSFAREAQLIQPATSRFVESVERRGIGTLFADGADLANRLARCRGGDQPVVPQLQLIRPGDRDTTTGILLQDVWRYARHYWSIPYQSTPGRNMFYLIRDEALPSRPLIGIAALGNPVLGLSQRDRFYGWSAQGLHDRLKDLSAQRRREIATHLHEAITRGLDETYSEDLLPEGWASHQRDWREIVEHLEQLEQKSAAERLEQLKEAGEDRGADYRIIRDAHAAVGRGEEQKVDWLRIAKTTLYKRKRAGTLADLVRAHGTFAGLGFSSGGGSIEEAFESEEGVRAVEVALRRVKQQVLASSVMELITCGAVPPYRDVLGGKLAAMLMLSREVADNFEERYSGRVSLIASALAGQPVYRPTRLALITTSSLYAVGSSQYNRIKVPTDSGSLAYKRIGKTDSFGTVHFAPDTMMNLSALARASDSNRRRVNNLFGEGTSPKLRLLRAGIENLGLEPDTFLRHHSPRLLYGASLCSNIDEVALGLSQSPEYLLPSGTTSTEIIAKHWSERWLANRAGRQEILERLRDQHFDDFRLSREVDALGEATEGRRAAQTICGALLEPAGTLLNPSQGVRAEQSGEQTFVERLYRSSNSYADRLNSEELDTIHVGMGIDDYLLTQAEAGRQVIVTGNPGDGKTHLIERLRDRLEAFGTVVITDANACSNREILDTWRSCREQERPFVLAINEWPLFVLRRTAEREDFSAVGEAIRQVTSARFFVDSQEPDDPKENVIVIDLSLRNLLTPSVVERVVERLTQDRFYEGLNPADPMLTNRRKLRHPRVLERLTTLLRLVETRIGHVTMRQLVGFVAYLLTGGRPAADRLRDGQDASGFSYSDLAFEGGVGPLFDAVRAVFDPVAVTHPEWDERLWLGETEGQEWLDQAPLGPLTLPEARRDEAYQAIKRRFFFEHEYGADLLALLPDDEREFEHCLAEGAGTGLVRDLVLALNRFYEPECSDNERDSLQLWQSHRYDVRAPSTFVALRRLPHGQLRVEPMRIASWVANWLPEDQQSRRSFALVAFTPERKDVAFMEVDRELYLTLYEARRGLGRSSWSRTATRRITRFVDLAHHATKTTSEVEDVRIRNVENALEETFEVRRDPARYRL